MASLNQLKRRRAVEDIDTDDPTGYVALLKNGYCYEDQGVHVVGEDTLAELERTLKEVRPCRCEDCKAGLVKWS